MGPAGLRGRHARRCLLLFLSLPARQEPPRQQSWWAPPAPAARGCSSHSHLGPQTARLPRSCEKHPEQSPSGRSQVCVSATRSSGGGGAGARPKQAPPTPSEPGLGPSSLHRQPGPDTWTPSVSQHQERSAACGQGRGVERRRWPPGSPTGTRRAQGREKPAFWREDCVRGARPGKHATPCIQSHDS